MRLVAVAESRVGQDRAGRWAKDRLGYICTYFEGVVGPIGREKRRKVVHNGGRSESYCSESCTREEKGREGKGGREGICGSPERPLHVSGNRLGWHIVAFSFLHTYDSYNQRAVAYSPQKIKN